MTLNERQEQLCKSSCWNFSDLRVVFLNCTLKRSPEGFLFGLRDSIEYITSHRIDFLE